MTFDDLVFFYALISCPSDQPETKNRRQALKNFFDAVLTNHQNPTIIASLNTNLRNLTLSSNLQKLLGNFDSGHTTLIQSVIQAISANFKTAVIDTITRHSQEYNRPLDGYQNYLEECRQEAYPDIEKYNTKMFASTAYGLDAPSNKLKPPSFNPNQFFNSASTETQPLMEADAKKSACSPCCSLL